MSVNLTTTGKQYLACTLVCGGTVGSCHPYWMTMSTCAAAAAAGDTGIFASAGATGTVRTYKTSATCEYKSAVDTYAIIGTVCATCAGPFGVLRAGSYWMSSCQESGLFISGDHTLIDGLVAADQVQYTITLQFT